MGSTFALPKRMFYVFFLSFFFLEPKYLTFPVNGARYALFTDPQILLFNNFFIKNGFHDTIYTFKNYFATVFFSFIFQFLAVFKRIQFERRKTLFSLTALFLNVYVLLLSFFLSSFACSHSRNSSRLHLVLIFSLLFCLLSLTQLFKTALSPHTLGLHFFFLYSSLAEWPPYLFVHLFLPFSLLHS